MELKANIKINNMTTAQAKYEYIVARIYGGEFWFWGAYKNEADAKAGAEYCDGVVIHNTH